MRPFWMIADITTLDPCPCTDTEYNIYEKDRLGCVYYDKDIAEKDIFELKQHYPDKRFVLMASESYAIKNGDKITLEPY